MMQGAVVKKHDLTGRLKQRDNLKRQHSEVLKAGIHYCMIVRSHALQRLTAWRITEELRPPGLYLYW